MKAKLIYDLENQDDSIKLLRAMKSEDMIFAIYDIINISKKLHRMFENMDNTDNDVFDGINEYTNMIVEVLVDRGINVDELMH
jgi:hypothetical protein